MRVSNSAPEQNRFGGIPWVSLWAVFLELRGAVILVSFEFIKSVANSSAGLPQALLR
jgi:hypothetical protein